MSDDRYATITREVPVDRPRNTVFVPSDAPACGVGSTHHTHKCERPVGHAGVHVGRGCSWDEDAAVMSSDLNSQHRVSLHPAGFRVRERGALSGTVVHAYRCPVHGLVDVRVPRSYVPDVVPCSLISWCLPGGDKEYASREEVVEIGRCLGFSDNELTDLESQRCADDCTWAGSQAGQGWAAGECKS